MDLTVPSVHIVPFPQSVDALMAAGAGAGMQGLNRTVYLGNIHPETSTGGSVQLDQGWCPAEHTIHAG